MAKKIIKTVYLSNDGKTYDNLAQANEADKVHKSHVIHYKMMRQIDAFIKKGKYSLFLKPSTDGRLFLVDVYNAFAAGEFDGLIKELPNFIAKANKEYNKEIKQ